MHYTRGIGSGPAHNHVRSVSVQPPLVAVGTGQAFTAGQTNYVDYKTLRTLCGWFIRLHSVVITEPSPGLWTHVITTLYIPDKSATLSFNYYLF